MKDKVIQSYKEKAKNYYLGMKNNWVGNTQVNIKHFEDYKMDNNDRKSKTANLSIRENKKPVHDSEFEKNQKDQKQVNQPGFYKRLNKEYYKDKLREERGDTKQPKFASPKNKKVSSDSIPPVIFDALKLI